jgi:hypothetical protein
MSCLFDFLTLIEVLKFTIEELFDKFVQIFANFVEKYDFSVFMNIRIRVVFLAL